MAKGLTKKQQVFVAEYLTDMNATRAAVSAGYAGNSAEVTGCKLLRNAKVQEVIEKKTAERCKKLDISADYVLQNIREVGERCMQKSWPKLVRRGREMVQVTEEVEDPETGEIVEADVYQFDSFGALKAQELLGKHLKLFTDKVEHSGKVTLEQLITDAE